MPTAACGAQLLLNQLTPRKNPKTSSTTISRIQRLSVKQHLPGFDETLREQDRMSDRSREFIETVVTPRNIQREADSRYTNDEQFVASLPFSELFDVVSHFSLPDKASKSYLDGVDISEEEFYLQPRPRIKLYRRDAKTDQQNMASQLNKLSQDNDSGKGSATEDIEDPDKDEFGFPLWTVLAKRPMAEMRATDGIDDELTRHLFKEYISMRNLEMASDQIVQCLPVKAVEYKRPTNSFMSPSRRFVMDHMRKSLNMLQDGFCLETHKKVCSAPEPPPRLTRQEFESCCRVRATQLDLRTKLAEQRRDENDNLRLEALRKKKEIHDLKLKIFAMYGISLRALQSRWLPAVYLAQTAAFLEECCKKARLLRLMMKIHVRMAVMIQRFIRCKQKKMREEFRLKEISKACICIRKWWYLFKLRNVGQNRKSAVKIIKDFLDEVRKTNLLRRSVSIYRRRIIQVQRWIRRILCVFRARLTVIITSMNIACLKHKKETALKRESKFKRSGGDSAKTVVPLGQPNGAAVQISTSGVHRRKSLVTFNDSKAEKQFFEKSFAMWNMLDKFSRSKVCERVLQKMYRSNRMDVIEYCTKTLPKWEAWKAAEDIRDSVKFAIGDASRRRRWSECGAMAAPEYPRFRLPLKNLILICENPTLYRWLFPTQGLHCLIGMTILEVLPESMFSTGPPPPASGKGSKASPRKKY